VPETEALTPSGKPADTLALASTEVSQETVVAVELVLLVEVSEAWVKECWMEVESVVPLLRSAAEPVNPTLGLTYRVTTTWP
jgi:hypothetical protein